MNIINKEPLISVIIPLYNKAPYIKRALDSILSQTIQNFEVIVVGGKSTDGSENIVREYMDSRITLIDESGTGVSAARNQGINVARAELIAFLDADDEWLPDFLETVLTLRDKYPQAGIYGTGFGGVAVDKKYKWVTDDTEQVLITNYCGYMCRYNHIIICPSSSMIPKDILINIGMFNEDVQWGEDRDLYCRISLIYPIAYDPNIHSITYLDTIENSNMTTKGMDKSKFLELIWKNGNCIINNENYQDIIEYSDRLNISIASRYEFISNSHESAKEHLQHVKRKYHHRWIMAYVWISTPEKMRPIIRKIYHGFRTILNM